MKTLREYELEQALISMHEKLIYQILMKRKAP